MPQIEAHSQSPHPSHARFARRPAAGGRDSELLAGAIARAKAGDNDALRFLYVRFADDVCAYVQSIVNDHHEAQDITHNLFVKLLSKIQRYQQQEVPFAAWILRVARNAALDNVRARRVIPVDEVRTSDEGAEETGYERGQSLRLALERLSPDQREVLVLRHIAGLSPPEIARRLKRSESSVHGLHHRARGTLRLALTELDAAPVTAGA